MRIATIDIGATTLSLLQAEVAQGQLTRQLELRRFTRGGDRALVSGVISDEAWESGIEALDVLIERAHKERPDRLAVVATSVVREASNGPAFRKALEQRYDVPVRVLSAAEEAKLSYRGVRASLRGDEVLAAVDLGGGTVNFAVGHGESCQVTASLPLGAIRLAPAFTPNGSLARADAEALSLLVGRSLGAIANRGDELGATALAFSSGHARAVREYVMQATELPGPTGLLPLDRVCTAHASVIGTRPADLVGRGVRPERAATIAIALSVLRRTMESLGCSQALVVDYGLREGVVLTEAEALRTRPAEVSAEQ